MIIVKWCSGVVFMSFVCIAGYCLNISFNYLRYNSAADSHTLLTSARNIVQVYLCPVLSVGRYMHTHGHAVFSAVLTQDPERWTRLTRMSKQCVLGNQTPTNTEVNKLYITGLAWSKKSFFRKCLQNVAIHNIWFVFYNNFCIIIIYLLLSILLLFFYQLRALHRNLATHAY